MTRHPFADWHGGVYRDDDVWVAYIADRHAPYHRIIANAALSTRGAAEAAAANLLAQAKSADAEEVQSLMARRRHTS